MTKTLLAAAILATGLLAGGATGASAGPLAPNLRQHSASVVITVGHRRDQWRRYDRFRRHLLPRWRVARSLERRGFLHCRGGLMRRGVYSFRCVRHGRVYAVRIDGHTGGILRRWRVG